MSLFNISSVAGMLSGGMSGLADTASQAANRAANKVINRATGRVMGIAQNYVDSLLSRIPGQFTSLFTPSEDFNRLRHINHQLVTTEFQGEWNFKLDIPGAPSDFDFYLKDISYGLFEVGTDEEHYGAAGYNWPNADQILRLSFTMRDNIDGRNQMFFHTWYAQALPADGGVVGLPLGPSGYVRKITVFNIDVEGTETPFISMNCYPIQVGEISRSRENGQFMEVPVTLAQFASAGTP